MHKYGPDGTFGATWHPWMADGKPEAPIQEDGTALRSLSTRKAPPSRRVAVGVGHL